MNLTKAGYTSTRGMTKQELIDTIEKTFADLECNEPICIITEIGRFKEGSRQTIQFIRDLEVF